ncbi:HIT family protein [Cryptosporangium phraense]|uniref:HIT family protein n=1 Tax=Cryptosporangium phraense TaxID=2593070 RepID=A0A545AP94_9ACTN|nr:HIT family protein [Cryptosporangium phraense]
MVRRACFVCELLAGSPAYLHHVVHRDDLAVVFLSRFPSLWGHVLVAPVAHHEHVIGDFDLDSYLALQRRVHAVGSALTAAVRCERLYVLSLGSQQGNRHVHWHLVPLPPGTPYDEQQIAALGADRGYLDVPDGAMADLANAIARRIVVR